MDRCTPTAYGFRWEGPEGQRNDGAVTVERTAFGNMVRAARLRFGYVHGLRRWARIEVLEASTDDSDASGCYEITLVNAAGLNTIARQRGKAEAAYVMWYSTDVGEAEKRYFRQQLFHAAERLKLDGDIVRLKVNGLAQPVEEKR